MNWKLSVGTLAIVALLLFVWKSTRSEEFQMPEDFPKLTEEVKKPGDEKADTKLATFGGGCFWCTEAIFLKIKGVKKVESGYSGGKIKNPTYEQICTGTTGHAEVIQITYDPKEISYADLLEVFWRTHNPTTLNQQGADVGTQYRSVVFYHDDDQKKLAETYKKKIDEAKVYDKPLVTEITEMPEFYPAEKYHQNYYNLNKNAGYCRAVIQPKLEKLEKIFKEKLKDEK